MLDKLLFVVPARFCVLFAGELLGFGVDVLCLVVFSPAADLCGLLSGLPLAIRFALTGLVDVFFFSVFPALFFLSSLLLLLPLRLLVSIPDWSERVSPSGSFAVDPFRPSSEVPMVVLELLSGFSFCPVVCLVGVCILIFW